eukprot:GEMP01004416.1.p1 GENE.GEMP01004416.1~~GEMP01004416.1.p1  ORF type:complete len:794 (+),score=145.08 GEMP01004416.1:169-2550(+)
MMYDIANLIVDLDGYGRHSPDVTAFFNGGQVLFSSCMENIVRSIMDACTTKSYEGFPLNMVLSNIQLLRHLCGKSREFTRKVKEVNPGFVDTLVSVLLMSPAEHENDEKICAFRFEIIWLLHDIALEKLLVLRDLPTMKLKPEVWDTYAHAAGTICLDRPISERLALYLTEMLKSSISIWTEIFALPYILAVKHAPLLRSMIKFFNACIADWRHPRTDAINLLVHEGICNTINKKFLDILVPCPNNAANVDECIIVDIAECIIALTSQKKARKALENCEQTIWEMVASTLNNVEETLAFWCIYCVGAISGPLEILHRLDRLAEEANRKSGGPFFVQKSATIAEMPQLPASFLRVTFRTFHHVMADEVNECVAADSLKVVERLCDWLGSCLGQTNFDRYMEALPDLLKAIHCSVSRLNENPVTGTFNKGKCDVQDLREQERLQLLHRIPPLLCRAMDRMNKHEEFVLSGLDIIARVRQHVDLPHEFEVSFADWLRYILETFVSNAKVQEAVVRTLLVLGEAHQVLNWMRRNRDAPSVQEGLLNAFANCYPGPNPVPEGGEYIQPSVYCLGVDADQTVHLISWAMGSFPFLRAKGIEALRVLGACPLEALRVQDICMILVTMLRAKDHHSRNAHRAALCALRTIAENFPQWIHKEGLKTCCGSDLILNYLCVNVNDEIETDTFCHGFWLVGLMAGYVPIYNMVMQENNKENGDLLGCALKAFSELLLCRQYERPNLKDVPGFNKWLFDSERKWQDREDIRAPIALIRHNLTAETYPPRVSPRLCTFVQEEVNGEV